MNYVHGIRLPKRAKSYFIGSFASNSFSFSVSSITDLKSLDVNNDGKLTEDELKNLKELLDSDIITQDEFNIKKKQILDL